MKGLEPVQEAPESIHWILEAVGRRYHHCTIDGYEVQSDEQAKAVAQCRNYITRFGEHARNGVSLVFLGPKGTGKDHLMIAVVKAICLGYPQDGDSRNRAVYRDGLRLFAEFRAAMNRTSNVDEDAIVAKYVQPRLLALSDPVPPAGELSEYEKRMILRIIDGRYRECLPMTATLNVKSRGELDHRLGPQAADRLCDDAVTVFCNWKSYRMRSGK